MNRNKKPSSPPIRERVILLEHDGHSVEILPALEVNHERILTPGHVIPYEDVTEYISPEGRVYVVHAPEVYLQETKHLAMVEMSTVIRQTVNFQRPGAATRPEGNFLKILPWLLAGASLLMLILKK